MQRYDYDTRYVGLGSEGTLLTPNLRYSAELVGEFGKTYSHQTVSDRDDVCALAFDATLSYLFPISTHPRLTFEYLYASGDKDHFLSATATSVGNLAGTNDNDFNAFGYRDLGLSFAPRLSNLHVYTLGAGFFPLETIDLFRKMEVGTKVFFYHKAANGPVSDETAVRNARCLGWEWDVYCDWRITSDLTWTVRYGGFRPGPAFRDRSCRDFFYTGVTLSF
jgi:hypothetical protein